MRTGYSVNRAAFMVAVASALQVLESFFPHPVPGVRLGLANMVALFVLVRYGPAAALELSALRVAVSSLFLGSFMTPAFVMSLGAALASWAVMAGAYAAVSRMKKPPLSLTGISVLGALAHNAAQLLLVYTFFIRTPAVLNLMPWLGLSAAVTGALTGLGASAAVRAGVDAAGEPAAVHAQTADGRRRAPAAGAVTGFFALVCFDLAVIMSRTAGDFMLVCAAAATAAILTRGAGLLARNTARMSFFIAFSFMVPALTSSGTLGFTPGGLREGAACAARIILLISSASLYFTAAGTAGAAKAMSRAVSMFGLKGGRYGKIAALSMAMMPAVMEQVKKAASASVRRAGVMASIREAGLSVAGLVAGVKREEGM